MYPLIKHVHVVAAALSIAGFALRGTWMLLDMPQRHTRLARSLPHVIDSVLLAAAIWLAVSLAQYPLTDAWLTAKVVALLVYIGLGMVALRFGRTRGQRALAFAGALLTFGYIVLVALTRDPWPFAA